MVKILGKEFSKDDIRERVGSLRQFAGAAEIEYKNGRQDGVKALDVKNGTGLAFKILLDRAMDIGETEYMGVPVAWQCKCGIVSPRYFENGGNGFLRGFYGGMLTACGLTQAGNPCEDEDELLGMHGRISNIPTDRHTVDEYWEDGDFVVRVSGSAREACLYAENLVLNREIICKSSEPKIYINDTIVNEGFNESPFMMIYHTNFGFPVISEYTKLYTTAGSVEPWPAGAENCGGFDSFEKPTAGYECRCFMHNMPKGAESACAALVNEEMGFGAYAEYNPKQLPYLNEWKMLGQQDYVVGIEPGTNMPEGRNEARANGRLKTLKPGEAYKVNYAIGVLYGGEEIRGFLNKRFNV